ncbi:hypothetical protein J3F83DRAFT_99681 [Trichoderma novae-zelandiae]
MTLNPPPYHGRRIIAAISAPPSPIDRLCFRSFSYCCVEPAQSNDGAEQASRWLIRGVSSFYAWRALSARRLSAASLCRPLAAGPSGRWTAPDLVHRLSLTHPQPQPAEEARPLAGTGWSGGKDAGHPGRHPGPARLKQRATANGIMTFLESSRGSTAELWRLYSVLLLDSAQEQAQCSRVANSLPTQTRSLL